MTRTIIDLSVALDPDIDADPPGLGPSIRYVDHDEGAADFERLFGIAVDQQLDGKGAAVERVDMTTHNGTHMDAPWHYHPTMNHGERAWTIDEIPLHWCIGHGVKLDFRDRADGHVVSVDELKHELDRIAYTLRDGDIVLINTSAAARYGEPDYTRRGCGMGRESTLWLAKQGIRVCGTDAWSWDPPLHLQAQNARQTGNYQLFWEAHKAGAECTYCHIEKLCNLELLPAVGFEVIALPVKIARASAGWCRAVALVDKSDQPEYQG